MDELEATLAALADCLRVPPARGLSTVFAPSFLVHTPEPLLRTRLDYLVAQFGAAESIRVCERLSERSARICARFAQGYATHGEIAIDEERPPRIQWLRFDLPTRDADSWADIARDVQALPGETGFEVRDLSRGVVLAAVAADLPLGVGSVSKLVLFRAVLEEVVAGRRRWEDLVALADRDRSLPTGLLQDWPTGAPLTLHTVTALLVSISDNTAADLLLRELGREQIDERVEPRNRPFLSTRGIFALVAGSEARRRAWAAADPAARRALLEAAEAEPLPDLGQVNGPWPAGLDWMFSAAELGALLERLAPALAESAAARAMLSINRGGLSLGPWPFSGFKGGSSPGRVAFAVLLESERHEWFGISLVNNATPDVLRVEMVAQLIKRAADQLRAP
jgi:beta-lactamase class A